MNLITMETHSRDINASMIDDGFDTKECFKWVSQLKTRYVQGAGEPAKTVWIYICDAEFRYSFEYLGNAPRLVITPLTDRIYVTATQARSRRARAEMRPMWAPAARGTCRIEPRRFRLEISRISLIASAVTCRSGICEKMSASSTHATSIAESISCVAGVSRSTDMIESIGST